MDVFSDLGAPPRAPREPVRSRTIPPIHPTKIPPRQWGLGRFLLFGSAAVIGATDGVGKGAIAIAMMLSVITGKPLLGEKVWRTGHVSIISYEDDETNGNAGVAACIHYGLDQSEILPQIHFIYQPDGGRVKFADMENGRIIFPDSDSIVDSIKADGSVMLLIDPFNHAHDTSDGNNNAMIAKVAGEMFRIAKETGAALLLLHHLRKGSKGDAEI